MKKPLIISLVAVALVVGGGSYMMLTSDKNKNFAQYLPESLKGVFTNKSEEVAVETLESDTQINEVSQQADLIHEENSETTAIELENNINQLEASKEIKSEETIDSNNDPIDAIKVIEPKPEQTKIPTEVVNLEKELVEINTTISKLDEENQKLEIKFKQMLKENKDLAVKLSQIDEKLSTSN